MRGVEVSDIVAIGSIGNDMQPPWSPQPRPTNRHALFRLSDKINRRIDHKTQRFEPRTAQHDRRNFAFHASDRTQRNADASEFAGHLRAVDFDERLRDLFETLRDLRAIGVSS